MSWLGAWVLLPACLLFVSLGCGLLVERGARDRLPGVLIVPVGYCAIVVATQLTTMTDVTAEASLPVVLLLALAGVILGRGRLRHLRPDGWAAAAALGVFCVYAAPVALAGAPTFAGYTVLGDTVVSFLGVDHLMSEGRGVGALEPSSYAAEVASYFDRGAYPTGAVTALGAIAPLAMQDVAWIFQPYLAVLMVLLALVLYGLVARLGASRPLRALAAFVAAQPALAVGYALQGSIKELGTAFVVVLLVALVGQLALADRSWRAVIPMAVATAAALGIVSLAVAPWLGLILLAASLVALRPLRAPEWRSGTARSGAFALLVAALSLPTLVVSTKFVETTGFVTAQEEFGNLLRPLAPVQALGVWLAGDYRLEPSGELLGPSYLLAGVTATATVFGLIAVVRHRRRSWPVLLYAVVSAIAAWYAIRNGSPWADGKAWMIISPAAVLLAMVGALALWQGARRVEGALLAAVVASGVVVSNALAYHDVSSAPRDRLAELETIGERIGDRGPTLAPEFEEYAKHFLRRGAPEAPSEPYVGRPVEASSGPASFGLGYDLDQLAPAYIDGFRWIVLRRGPGTSRPPAAWRRRSVGRYYEVWERPRGGGVAREHLPVGTPDRAVARTPCAPVRRLARRARRARAQLAFAAAPEPAVFSPVRAALPPNWVSVPGPPPAVIPSGPGTIEGTLAVPSGATGRQEVWLQGSFGREVAIEIGGRRVGSVRDDLSARDESVQLGTAALPAGRHRVRIVRAGGDLRPGNGGSNRQLGVLSLRPARASTVRTVAPSRWGEACAGPVDWIEIVEG